MQQEVLVLNAVHSVQEKHYGCLVVRHEGCGHLRLYQRPIYGQGGWGVSLCFTPSCSLPASLSRHFLPPSTFAQRGDLQWEADDAHKVVQGHKGPKDGSDPQGLTLSRLDQLEMVDRGIGLPSDNCAPSGNCSIPAIPDTRTVKQASFVCMCYVPVCMWRHVCVRTWACGCKYVHLPLYPERRSKVDVRWLSFSIALPLFFETVSH